MKNLTTIVLCILIFYYFVYRKDGFSPFAGPSSSKQDDNRKLDTYVPGFYGPDRAYPNQLHNVYLNITMIPNKNRWPILHSNPNNVYMLALMNYNGGRLDGQYPNLLWEKTERLVCGCCNLDGKELIKYQHTFALYNGIPRPGVPGAESKLFPDLQNTKFIIVTYDVPTPWHTAKLYLSTPSGTISYTRIPGR